jgi:hypothetical protein
VEQQKSTTFCGPIGSEGRLTTFCLFEVGRVCSAHDVVECDVMRTRITSEATTYIILLVLDTSDSVESYV